MITNKRTWLAGLLLAFALAVPGIAQEADGKDNGKREPPLPTAPNLTQAPNPATPAPNQTPAQLQEPAAGRLGEAQIRARLEAQGYSQITGSELKGMDYEVRATKSGQSFRLVVDSTTGQVKSSSPN
jgi:hypothetical protein